MSVKACFADFGLNELQAWAVERQLPVLFERSIRMQEHSFEDHRLLFSFPIEAIGVDASVEVLQICRSMRTPDRFLSAIERFITSAAFVHFGFERAGETLIGKCYLELPSQTETSDRPMLTFLGYKWSSRDDSLSVVSRYSAVPCSAWNQLTEPLLTAIPMGVRSEVEAFCRCFQPEVDSDCQQYRLLEVQEEGSQRLSWDLNVYSAMKTISDVQSCVLALAERLQIVEPATNWIAQNIHQTIGHIAAGTGRTGKPFVTIYHSAGLSEL